MMQCSHVSYSVILYSPSIYGRQRFNRFLLCWICQFFADISPRLVQFQCVDFKLLWYFLMISSDIVFISMLIYHFNFPSPKVEIETDSFLHFFFADDVWECDSLMTCIRVGLFLSYFLMKLSIWCRAHMSHIMFLCPLPQLMEIRGSNIFLTYLICQYFGWYHPWLGLTSMCVVLGSLVFLINNVFQYCVQINVSL